MRIQPKRALTPMHGVTLHPGSVYKAERSGREYIVQVNPCLSLCIKVTDAREVRDQRPKAPRLVPVDLSKGKQSDHPDIKTEARYLAKIDGSWFAGAFSRQWYGWSFDGWGGGGGCQFNTPGYNHSMWDALYEIRG